MGILKLKEAGDTATLVITACEKVEGEYGMQVKFDADNGDVIYVPQSSVDRQMDRMGVADYASCVGKTLTFFRAPNHKPGGKPFWNIDKARAEDVRTPRTNGNGAKLLPYETGDEDYLQETGGPPQATQAKAAPRPAVAEAIEATDKFKELADRYDECVGHVVKELRPAFEHYKIELDGQTIAAMAATLFIARNQARV